MSWTDTELRVGLEHSIHGKSDKSVESRDIAMANTMFADVERPQCSLKFALTNRRCA
jgi:hypothetical protein